MNVYHRLFIETGSQSHGRHNLKHIALSFIHSLQECLHAIVDTAPVATKLYVDVTRCSKFDQPIT